jgi:Fic family protein
MADILDFMIKQNKSYTSLEISTLLGISKVAAARGLMKLVKERYLVLNKINKQNWRYSLAEIQIMEE